jgi:hypothetical protein
LQTFAHLQEDSKWVNFFVKSNDDPALKLDDSVAEKSTKRNWKKMDEKLNV